MSILAAAIIALSPVGPIYQAIFTVPAAIVETIMTCKVFRAMILRSLDVDDNVSAARAELYANATATELVALELMQTRITSAE